MSPEDVQMSKGFCSDCPYSMVLGRSTENEDGNKVLCHHSSRISDLVWWCENHPLRRVHILAEKAMVELTSVNELSDAPSEVDAVARAAYQYADAMIAEAAKRVSGVKSPSSVVDKCPNCGADGTASVLRDSFGVRIICSGLTACGYSPGPYESEQEAWAAWRGEAET